MIKYLYGASVQGIQSFIFETSKLKEIVGASELVEQICTTEFANFCMEHNHLIIDDNVIMRAAGNIKYVFESKQDCEQVVLTFPKQIMENAPGIAISQSVVKFEGELQQDNINQLEQNLKIQRNRVKASLYLALMISERARNTGNASVDIDDKDKKNIKAIDKAQVLKQKQVDSSVLSLSIKLTGKQIEKKDFTFEVDDIAKGQKGNKNWIAVIHADGNNLGKFIQKMAKSLKGNGKSNLHEAFKEFSLKLDEATITAAQTAYNKVVAIHDGESKMPIRPIVIGGDDLTVVIRGDLALNFTDTFLQEFELETKNKFSKLVKEYGVTEFENGLTACAGIAYIKPKYPFHYAVNLAEELCSFAKKQAKEINKEFTPSALMFHKVQSSFTENFDKDIIEKELTAKSVSFVNGPYYLDETLNKPTVKRLNKQLKTINEDNAPKSGLRNWLNELHHSPESAKQLMERIIKLNSGYVKSLDLKVEPKEKTHIYDIIALSNIENPKA